MRTSIDPRVQQDAEQALSGVHKSAALVAVNAATGQVLAAVTVPAGGGFNLALDGSFPPGSSFKVLTSTALLEHGLSPSSPASCPPQLDVGGEIFHNAEGDGQVSDLLHAFAESCNTAFIGLATRDLTAADFTRTAARYLIGTTPSLGLPAFARLGPGALGPGRPRRDRDRPGPGTGVAAEHGDRRSSCRYRAGASGQRSSLARPATARCPPRCQRTSSLACTR